jgi:hypothetical protein
MAEEMKTGVCGELDPLTIKYKAQREAFGVPLTAEQQLELDAQTIRYSARNGIEGLSRLKPRLRVVGGRGMKTMNHTDESEIVDPGQSSQVTPPL